MTSPQSERQNKNLRRGMRSLRSRVVLVFLVLVQAGRGAEDGIKPVRPAVVPRPPMQAALLSALQQRVSGFEIDFSSFVGKKLLATIAAVVSPLLRSAGRELSWIWVPGDLFQGEAPPFVPRHTLAFNATDLNISGLDSLGECACVGEGQLINASTRFEQLAATVGVATLLKGPIVGDRQSLALAPFCPHVTRHFPYRNRGPMYIYHRHLMSAGALSTLPAAG